MLLEMIVKRIGPVSCAKISGTLYAIIGLVIGSIFSLVALVGGLAARTHTAGGMAAVLGVGAIVAFPILYGAIGFVSSLVVAWLYNVLAGLVGGVQIDVE